MTMRSVRTIVPPSGGRTHSIRVSVDESCDWNNAIALGTTGQTAMATDYNAHMAGDLYPPKKGVTVIDRDVILVNFGRSTTSSENLQWAKQNDLTPASPRVIFAIGKYCPHLNDELGMNAMRVSSLESRLFQNRRIVLCVRWEDAIRGSCVSYLHERWYNDVWFAFVYKEEMNMNSEKERTDTQKTGTEPTKSIVCPVCREVFISADEYDAHLSIVHGQGINPWFEL